MANMRKAPFTDIIFELQGQIGIIKFNRPKSLNAFGGRLILDVIQALRELNVNPDIVFTVITGEGRFFSSGADVKAAMNAPEAKYAYPAEKKVAQMQRVALAMELLRSMIDHKKVLILALNGPAVGGGAVWFQGVADIVVAADNVWLQAPFSALGLVPEFGSVTTFAQSMGVHRANEILMFGEKITVQELKQHGLVNRIFPQANFHQNVMEYLEQELAKNDGQSMMEAKRLQNLPLRRSRILAVYDAAEALSERIVADAQKKRFEEKHARLQGSSNPSAKL